MGATISISFLIKLCRTRGPQTKQKLGERAKRSFGLFHDATETKTDDLFKNYPRLSTGTSRSHILGLRVSQS